MLLSPFLVALGALPLEPESVDVDYVVALADPANPVAVVTATVRGHSGAPLRLGGARRYAFVSLDEPLLVGDVRAVVADGEVGATVRWTEPYVWEVEPRDAQAVDLTWSVPLRHRELEQVRSNHDEYEFPYVDREHGMLVAGTLFFVPQTGALGEVTVRFELPPGWNVIAPWPESEPGVFRPPARVSLHDDLIAVGAWSTHRIVDEGDGGRLEVSIAFAPGLEKIEERAVEIVGSITRGELELFGVWPFEKYLFLFGRPDISGYGGSPKSGSMTLAVQPDVPRDRLDGFLAHLVGHEFHHTWGRSMGPFPGELRFLNEGFTDYYAYLVPARLGLTTWFQLADTLRGKVAAVEASSAWDELSLVEAGGPPFFERGEVYQLVYDGGLLLALLLDLELRRQGRGELDELMRAFVNADRPEGGPSLDDLLALVEERLGVEGRQRFARLASSAQRPDLRAELAASGLAFEELAGDALRERLAAP